MGQGVVEQEFARRFAEAWACPTPEGLVALLQPDVVLRQPHKPPIRGREAALAEFRRLLSAVPGLHGDIDRSSGADGVVFIEWRMKFLKDSDAAVPAVDRFLLKDGLAAERVVYFDQQRLQAQVMTHPSLWGGFLRYRFGG